MLSLRRLRGFWCLNTWRASEVEVRYPPPPPAKWVSQRYPMKTRQMGAIPPSRKGIARYGGVSRTRPLSSAGHRPVRPFLGLSVFPGKSPKLARILFPCRTHKNTGKTREKIDRRLRCIQHHCGQNSYKKLFTKIIFRGN